MSQSSSEFINIAELEADFPVKKPDFQVGDRIETKSAAFIICSISRGGMGLIYHAKQEGTNARMVIKVPIQDNAGKSIQRITRFYREANYLLQVRHPNIVRAHHVDQIKGTKAIAIVMEWINGIDLAHYLREEPLDGDEERFYHFALQILTALDYLHSMQPYPIVHRDIKPNNFMVTHGLRLVLIDFGIACIACETEQQILGDWGLLNTQITHTGSRIGTLRYMTPEQIKGGKGITGAADVYSLGIMFYKMLTNRFPFVDEGNWEQILHSRQHDKPVLHDVPRFLREVVTQMLHYKPQYRPASEQLLKQFGQLYRLRFGKAWNAETVETMPLSSFDWRLRAYSQSRLGCYSQALSSYNRAIQLRPEKASLYYNRALCHYKAGNFDASFNDLYYATKLYQNGARQKPHEACMHILSALYAKVEISTLVETLQHLDVHVRRYVLEASGNIDPGVKGVVLALANVFADSDYERSFAAKALRKIGRQAVPALVNALAYSDERVRASAAWALGEIRPVATQAVPALVNALADSDERVKVSAEWALGKIKGKIDNNAVPGLIKALGDQNSYVREGAVKALAEIGNSAVYALMQAAYDQNSASRRGAIEAIQLINSKNSSFSDDRPVEYIEPFFVWGMDDTAPSIPDLTTPPLPSTTHQRRSRTTRRLRRVKNNRLIAKLRSARQFATRLVAAIRRAWGR